MYSSVWQPVYHYWSSNILALGSAVSVLAVLVFTLWWRRSPLSQLLESQQDSAPPATVILLAAAILYLFGSYQEGEWLLWLSLVSFIGGYLILIGGPLVARSVVGPLTALTLLVPIPGLTVHMGIGMAIAILLGWVFLSRRRMHTQAKDTCEICSIDAISKVCGFCGKVRRLAQKISWIRPWSRIVTLGSLWILALSLAWPVFAMSEDGLKVNVYRIKGSSDEPLFTDPPGWLLVQSQSGVGVINRVYDVSGRVGLIRFGEEIEADTVILGSLEDSVLLESGATRSQTFTIYRRGEELNAVGHWSISAWFASDQGYSLRTLVLSVALTKVALDDGVEYVRNTLASAASSITSRWQVVTLWSNATYQISKLSLAVSDYVLSGLAVGAILTIAAIARHYDRRTFWLTDYVQALGAETRIILAALLRLQNRRFPTDGQAILNELRSSSTKTITPGVVLSEMNRLFSDGAVRIVLRLRASTMKAEWHLPL